MREVDVLIGYIQIPPTSLPRLLFALVLFLSRVGYSLQSWVFLELGFFRVGFRSSISLSLSLSHTHTLSLSLVRKREEKSLSLSLVKRW